MALTKDQFKELRKKGLSVDQIVSFERGKVPAKPAQVQGNQFEPEAPKSFVGKARNFITGVIGGGKLAEGAGMGLAAPKVQQQLTEAEQRLSDAELSITEQITKRKAEGGDTTRLENALAQLKEDMKGTRDAQTDFTGALPSNREVIGSAIRLGGTLAAPTLGGKAAKAFALGKPTSALGGFARGAVAGGTAGAIEGAIQGAGMGVEQELDAKGVALSAAAGAGVGAVTGGALGGVAGGVTAQIGGKAQRVLDRVTPNAADLTPREYKRLLAQGRITPKTPTQPATYILSDAEKDVATRYADVVTKDPVQTANNISDKIGDLDEEVGAFLKRNNSIFNDGELKNAITQSLEYIDDITIDEQRLIQSKQRLVDRFTTALEKNDMKTLWQARKDFDASIESAFKGSATIQKEVKIAFRNAIQDFIAERTPDDVYKGYMSDMSKLFSLRDTVATKATKERMRTGIEAWIKNNPTKAKVAGWGSALTATAIGGGAVANKIGSAD